MKTFFLSACLFSSIYACAGLPDARLADAVGSPECYRADVAYEVLLPDAETPVSYRLKLTGADAPGDTLSPCNYLIEWSATSPTGATSGGFSAYADGNYYQFNAGKLLEYHASDDPVPFAPGGDAAKGVQCRDRFAALLPQFIRRSLKSMQSDTACTVTAVRAADGTTEVRASERRRGFTVRESTLRLGSDGLPLESETVTGPGQMGELIITARYTDAATSDCPRIDEAMLMERYPEIFEKYRLDSFSLENLRGEPLPGFTAPTVTRERYSRERGDAFAVPTVIAVLDPAVDATAGVVATLREAIDALPRTCDLILAFTGNGIDAIEDIAGTETRPGERVLTSARALARDCGVTDSPSIIFCNTDGTVADIHVGRNNNLREIVIQKAAMTR